MPFCAKRHEVIAPPNPLPITMTSKSISHAPPVEAFLN
jgi:hypothetical protein